MRHFRGTILLMRGDPCFCDPVRGVLTLGNPGLADWAPSAERATEA